MNTAHHYHLAAATLAAHGWTTVLAIANAAHRLDRQLRAAQRATATKATRHAIHEALGSDHPERALRLMTPGQVAWTRKNVEPWTEV